MYRASIRYCSSIESSSLARSLCVLTTIHCTVLYLSTLVHQESGEQTERGEDSQTGGTQSGGEKGGPSIGQRTKEVATPLLSTGRGGGERPSSPVAKEQGARMSPLAKEQARVTFCTTPTSPTPNSSSKPPLQVQVTTTINLIHGDIVQGAARAVPILRNSESSSNGGARMRNKSESSKLGDQEDLKRLTAELEVVPLHQNVTALHPLFWQPKFIGRSVMVA